MIIHILFICRIYNHYKNHPTKHKSISFLRICPILVSWHAFREIGIHKLIEQIIFNQPSLKTNIQEFRKLKKKLNTK